MILPRSSILFLLLLCCSAVSNAFWLMGLGVIVTERLDPIVNPGKVSGHVHSVVGGSNFGFNSNTALLRQSKCTSSPISEDKSNYWFPHLYFQWANGSFTSANGGSVIYYLFSNQKGSTTAFPDDFRMLSGDPTLRSYDPNSFAQQAVSYLCLDFHGVSTRFTGLPNKDCPDGVRAQINFPSCWDGKNVDSADHKSHVAFPSQGPDRGSCTDPKFPVTLPRIFMEVYWGTHDFQAVRSQAKNPSQPFVFSFGDDTGFGYHADFMNGWDTGVLQRAVDGCTCPEFGDPTCCANQGIFHFNPQGNKCHISPQVDEIVLGTIPKLPGNNPVQGPQDAVNGHVPALKDPNPPQALFPPSAWTSDTPPPGVCTVGGPIGANCHVGPVPGAAGGGGSVPQVPPPMNPVPSPTLSLSVVPHSPSPLPSGTGSHSSAPASQGSDPHLTSKKPILAPSPSSSPSTSPSKPPKPAPPQGSASHHHHLNQHSSAAHPAPSNHAANDGDADDGGNDTCRVPTRKSGHRRRRDARVH